MENRYTFKDLFNELENLNLQTKKDDIITYAFYYNIGDSSKQILLEVCTYLYNNSKNKEYYDEYHDYRRWKYKLNINNILFFKLNAKEASINSDKHLIFNIEDPIPSMILPRIDNNLGIRTLTTNNDVFISNIKQYFTKLFNIIKNNSRVGIIEYYDD